MSINRINFVNIIIYLLWLQLLYVTWKRNDFLMDQPSKVFTIFYFIDHDVSSFPCISIAVITGKVVIPFGKATWLGEVHVIKIAPVCRTGVSTVAFTRSYWPWHFVSPFFCYCFNIETDFFSCYVNRSSVIFV